MGYKGVHGGHTSGRARQYTVRKNDIILRSIERMLQMQLYMVCKFPLWRLRRYSVKFSKVHNFTFNAHDWRKLITQARSEPTSYGSVVHNSTTAPQLHEKWMNFSNIYASFLLNLTDYVIFCANRYKMAENVLRHMLLKPITARV